MTLIFILDPVFQVYKAPSSRRSSISLRMERETSLSRPEPWEMAASGRDSIRSNRSTRSNRSSRGINRANNPGQGGTRHSKRSNRGSTRSKKSHGKSSQNGSAKHNRPNSLPWVPTIAPSSGLDSDVPHTPQTPPHAHRHIDRGHDNESFGYGSSSDTPYTDQLQQSQQFTPGPPPGPAPAANRRYKPTNLSQSFNAVADLPPPLDEGPEAYSRDSVAFPTPPPPLSDGPEPYRSSHPQRRQEPNSAHNRPTHLVIPPPATPTKEPLSSSPSSPGSSSLSTEKSLTDFNSSRTLENNLDKSYSNKNYHRPPFDSSQQVPDRGRDMGSPSQRYPYQVSPATDNSSQRHEATSNPVYLQSSVQMPSAEMHRPTKDMHRPTTEMHRPNTDMHRPNTDIHRPNTDIHRPNTDIHRPNTDMHRQTTDMHRDTTDIHRPHKHAGDAHRPTTDVHRPIKSVHGPSTDVHRPSANGHRPATDGHRHATAMHNSTSDMHRSPVNGDRPTVLALPPKLPYKDTERVTSPTESASRTQNTQHSPTTDFRQIRSRDSQPKDNTFKRLVSGNLSTKASPGPISNGVPSQEVYAAHQLRQPHTRSDDQNQRSHIQHSPQQTTPAPYQIQQAHSSHSSNSQLSVRARGSSEHSPSHLSVRARDNSQNSPNRTAYNGSSNHQSRSDGSQPSSKDYPSSSVPPWEKAKQPDPTIRNVPIANNHRTHTQQPAVSHQLPATTAPAHSLTGTLKEVTSSYGGLYSSRQSPAPSRRRGNQRPNNGSNYPSTNADSYQSTNITDDVKTTVGPFISARPSVI